MVRVAVAKRALIWKIGGGERFNLTELAKSSPKFGPAVMWAIDVGRQQVAPQLILI